MTSTEDPASPRQHRDVLSITDIAAYIRSHWKLCVFVMVLAVSVGVGLLVVVSPVYRSEVVLMPIMDDERGAQLTRLASQFGGLANLAGISLSSNTSANANLATLESLELIASFIERENLMPILYVDQWDADQDRWSDPAPTIEEAVKIFDEKIRQVIENKDSGLVVLRIEWTNPEVAASWALKLVELANNGLRSRAIEEARASMNFLQEELNETPIVELRQAIYALMEAETQKIMLAKVRPEYAFRIIDPPRIADRDDPVWPNAMVIVFASLFAGVAIVLLISVLMAPRRVA